MKTYGGKQRMQARAETQSDVMSSDTAARRKTAAVHYRRDVFEAQSARPAQATLGQDTLDSFPSIGHDKDGESLSGSDGSSNSLSKTPDSS